MKKFSIIILMAALVFMAAGCSIFSDTSASNTQSGNTTAASITEKQSSTIQGTAPVGDNIQNTGTQQGADKKKTVTLYFATEDNSAVKKEQREITVVNGAILKACVEALLEGPATPGLHKTIPDGTLIRGVNLKNNVAIVDFSQEFSAANDIAGVVERVSLVNTLTGINGVEAVRIHVEGKDLTGPSGKPIGEMRPAALDSNGLPLPGEMKTVTLYFGNANADKVVAEKREVEVLKGESLERVVFLELMKGPVTKGLYAPIPKGTRLLSVKTKDGLCTLDLSSEFVDNHPGGTAGESMTLNSIVNSLTELSGVKKVQFLIDGQIRTTYPHAVFDKPFARDESMIGKQ